MQLTGEQVCWIFSGFVCVCVCYKSECLVSNFKSGLG